jgi:FkbM family methyltransferase
VIGSTLKRIVAAMPSRWQEEAKRLHFARQIRRGNFVTHEPEYRLLDSLVASGDWVIDVGANVGHYTQRLSQLVGARGRVIALEPVPATFALLAANAMLFEHHNVSLLNLAASDRTTIAGINIPRFNTGLTNYYEAALTADTANLSVMTIHVDGLQLPERVKLVKIDAEGHERPVLDGMRALLLRDRPILILETHSTELLKSLEALGYTGERLARSPNVLLRPRVA